MALSNEDKKDVKTHMGKALAKKVAKVTNDRKMRAGNAVAQHNYEVKTGRKDYAGSKKVDLSKAFPGESRMDKLKSKVGSDNRKVNYKAASKSMARNEKKEPVQVSKEYHNGKWQKVGFYEGKGGKMSIKPYK